MSDRSNNKSILSSTSFSSDIGPAMFQHDEAKYVICPYDKAHRILRARLIVHLLRCARNHPSSKMVRCPFNSSHMQRSDELQAHIYECENRQTYERYYCPDKLPPNNSPYNDAVCVVHVDTTENWDIEPEAPTYNPQAYCEENKLIRNLQGASAAKRRQFRADERRRFKEN